MRKMKRFAEGGSVPDFSRLTFKEAFAAARKAPNVKGQFSWNGKTYSTELAKDKAEAPKAKATADETSAETRRLRREDDAAGPKAEALPEKKKRAMELPKVEYTDEVNEALMGAVPPGRVAKAIRDVGGAGVKAARDVVEKAMTRGKKAEEAAEKVEPGMWDIKTINPREGALTTGVKKAADYMGRYEPTLKKGGMVKSSASRRADGIAQRGKTKGRML